MLQRLFIFALSLLGIAPFASADDATPRDVRAVAAAVDRDIEAKLAAKERSPVELTGDEEFLRRAYLDITGRIPTAAQAQIYLASEDKDKRPKLINELLASPQYGEQFGRVWRDWVAPAELPSEGNGGNQPIKQTQDFGKWLAEQFNAGQPWNKIAHELLTVEGVIKEKPHVLFYSLIGDDRGQPLPGGSARAIGSLFLGVQMQCAECHDDPFKHWKQADFWGSAAFFRNVNWKFAGRYFDSISEGELSQADLKARKGTQVKDAAPPGSITIPKEAFKNAGDVIAAKYVDNTPYPTGNAAPSRKDFADWLTTKENPFFARAFVNRTWNYFFSRGFVFPVDDFRDENPPSHEAALDALTKEFIASGFDVRQLVRSICNTRAYQRSSRPKAAGDTSLVEHFGQMPVKVMSADMLYDSLKIALADPQLDLRSYDSKEAQRFGESSPTMGPYEEFARTFGTNEEDPTDFTHGIPQFLALINHPRLRSGGKKVDELLKANVDTDATITALYLGTLSREPTEDERAEAIEYATKGADPRKAANGLLWMLVNRSEFLLVR